MKKILLSLSILGLVSSFGASALDFKKFCQSGSVVMGIGVTNIATAVLLTKLCSGPGMPLRIALGGIAVGLVPLIFGATTITRGAGQMISSFE